ncbi:SDR family oxidoreductase [Acetobacterium sp.]|uniref:SDR family NAD(P)-dependent oxidoreductase n=1 Tax=Acetobacterium sp. TaxID=1872094 RepID=UPI00271901E0|nr:SDR family oxidoreductase [Acetobacterium sp.]MDO9490621.1 SDR family oxidoreductase [Acetobacterium sp.]
MYGFDNYFAGKTAVVTGGASGIGNALAETMLQNGAQKVAIADVNQVNLEKETTRMGLAYPGKIIGLFCNVTLEDNVKAVLADAAEFFGGRIDLLFNNAGAGLSGSFTELTNEDWQAAFDLNFYGALYGIRHVLPYMKAQGGGQIVNTISGIAWSPMALQSMYAVTKSALNMLGLTLRYELWDDHIKVNSATPGTTATAIFATGGVAAPDYAQTPMQSAARILTGVQLNQRLICGDDNDVEGSQNALSPDPAIQKGLDDYFLEVARDRKQGKFRF